MSSKKRNVVPAIIGVLILIVIGVQVLSIERHRAARAFLGAGIIGLPESRALPPLAFIDQDGQPAGIEQLKGKWSLVFFGYTFCPDLCPTTLTELRQLMERLPASDRDALRVLLVSIDPQRDTPAQLKQYLEYYNPSFVGWQGSIDQLQALATALSIPFIPPDTSKPGYSVEHSGNLAVLDPEGRQRGLIHSPLNVEALAEQLPKFMREP